MLFPRGPSLRCGVWLQVHWDVGATAAQRRRAVWGRGPPDSPASRREWRHQAQALHLQAQGEHYAEGAALPGPTGRSKQPAHGSQSSLQELPRPGRPLSSHIQQDLWVWRSWRRTLDSYRAAGLPHCGQLIFFYTALELLAGFKAERVVSLPSVGRLFPGVQAEDLRTVFCSFRIMRKKVCKKQPCSTWTGFFRHQNKFLIYHKYITAVFLIISIYVFLFEHFCLTPPSIQYMTFVIWNKGYTICLSRKTFCQSCILSLTSTV